MPRLPAGLGDLAMQLLQRMGPLALVLGALLLAAPAVRADIVTTTTGGRIVGRIIEEKETEIRIRTEKGPILTIPRDEIESIQREKLEDVFARRLKKLEKDDVK